MKQKFPDFQCSLRLLFVSFFNVSFHSFAQHWPVVAVFDVKEEEGSRHEHAQDSDGRQDAVEGDIYLPALQTHKCPILWRFNTYKSHNGSQSASLRVTSKNVTSEKTFKIS